MQIRRSFEFAAKEFGFAVATFAETPSRPNLVSKSINFHAESIRSTVINKSHFPEFGDHLPFGAADSIQYLSRTLDGIISSVFALPNSVPLNQLTAPLWSRIGLGPVFLNAQNFLVTDLKERNGKQLHFFAIWRF